MFKFRDNAPVDNRFYLTANESALTRSGRELLLSDSVAGDTVYFFQKMFNDGELVQTVTHKLTDLYASEDDYDPASGRRTFAEYFFRHDTLVSRTVCDYTSKSSDSAIFNDTYLREFVMVVSDTHTTAVQKPREQPAQGKRRPKISPRARYFDLLGRYRRAKIR